MEKISNKKLQHIALSELRVATLYCTSESPSQMIYGLFNSDFGTVMIASHDDKITALEFNDTPYPYKNVTFTRDDDHLSNLLEKDLNLLLIGTTFQHEVWKALINVEGTTSYSQLALTMNRPTATRAVASAVARNRISYFIPCHRIIHTDGTIGNYRWGSDIKKKLLAVQ